MATNFSNMQYVTQPMSTFQSGGLGFAPSPSSNYQSAAIFMPPMGSVYNLSNANEVGNIPMGSGVSVGLCLPEGSLYIKSLQNGVPAVLGYRLVPLEAPTSTNTNTTSTADTAAAPLEMAKIEEALKQYSEKITALDEKVNTLIEKWG